MAITVDLDYVFKNVYGHPIKEDQPDPDNADEVVSKELTLRAVSVNALLTNEQGNDGDEKARRWRLAMQLHEGENELTIKEASLIKKQIGKNYSPIIVGQAYDLLDPPKAKKKKQASLIPDDDRETS
ncbi:MAG TPA: hypothetical protein VFH61_03160 [Thermoleophilia bacterium]|nr:hypothetical protein [Thermoleophilia bacterium]